MLIQELSHEECIADSRSPARSPGVAFENQPYVVPIYFAYGKSTFGEPFLYGFTTPGQKVDGCGPIHSSVSNGMK